MLSWQRILALARKSPGPLFFFGETEEEEPVVVLPLRAYEALVQGVDDPDPLLSERIMTRKGAESSLGGDQPIQVPVRIERATNARTSDSDEVSLSPDLLRGSQPYESVAQWIPKTTPVPPPIHEEVHVPPEDVSLPALAEEERTLEERFYFMAPDDGENG